MAEQTTAPPQATALRRVALRLGARAPLLACGLLAIAAVALFAGAPWPAAAAALAFGLAGAFLPGPSPAPPASPPGEAEGQGASPPAAPPSGQDLAAALPDPLIVFDRAGAIVFANPAAHAAFGALTPGLPVLLRFRAPEMLAAIDRVRTGMADMENVELVERAPVERVFQARIAAAGEGQFAVVFRDRSDLHRLERMRADFIANASHELRTPLASIAGFVETLLGPARNDAAARERFLGIMRDQTGRMARLIDDLLSLSRLEVKPLAALDRDVEVNGLLEAVLDLLAPLAQAMSVAVERDFAPAPVTVRGDRDELFQVFQNLMENACKYGHAGGRVVVSVAGPPELSEVRVAFRDFGRGIEAEHIPRITERFYRVDVEASRAGKGTGLGLSIVKHILARHRGWLSIASRPGEGSTFTVHLPAG